MEGGMGKGIKVRIKRIRHTDRRKEVPGKRRGDTGSDRWVDVEIVG